MIWPILLTGLTFAQLHGLYDVTRDAIDDDIGMPRLLGNHLLALGIPQESWPDELNSAMVVGTAGSERNWLLESVALDLIVLLEDIAMCHLGYNAWYLVSELTRYREQTRDFIQDSRAVSVDRKTVEFDLWRICCRYGGMERLKVWMPYTLTSNRSRISYTIVLRELAQAIRRLDQAGMPIFRTS